jgi:hypothetical protein
MAEPGPDACLLKEFLHLPVTTGGRLTGLTRPGTSYRSWSSHSMAMFSSLGIPLLVFRPFLSEITLDEQRAAGAVAHSIEHIMEQKYCRKG